jgi:uncharacterized surface anchored protein
MKNMDQYYYSFGSSFPEPFAGESRSRSCQFWFGSTPAYCVEFGKEASSGMQYSTADAWDGISDKDRQLLSYCLMFGYAGTCRYGAQTSQEYMATQVLIWNILTHMAGTEWEQKIVDEIAGSTSRAQDVYWQIRENVYSADTIPSFCSAEGDKEKDYEMQRLPDGRYGITLEDKNGVLEYFTFKADGTEVTRNGNTLTVKTNLTGGEITFSAVKQFPGWTTGSAVFWRPSDGGYQYMASLSTAKAPDPVRASFSLTIPTGYVEIRKTSDDGDGVSGIGFTAVSGDGTVLSAVTDGEGKAVLESLPAGSVWMVSEDPVTVPDPYRSASGQTVTVTTGETAVLRFHNSLKTGKVRIIKRDVSDSEEGVPMQDVTFRIESEKTKETVTIITGEDGTALSDELPLGNYTITEETPEGYVETEPVSVSLTSDGEVFEVRIENRIYKSRLKIRKTDAGTGNNVALPGTGFRITDPDGNDINPAKDGGVFLIETDENGEAELPFSLRYGEYLIWEESAPEGYLRSEEPIRISVDPAKDSSGSIMTEFADEPATGTVLIEKKGLMLTASEKTATEYGEIYTPVWEERYLSGAVFGVTAAEDIVTADGTVRLYSGETACVLTTGPDGAAAADGLFPGSYMIREISAPDGYHLLTEPVCVTVTAEAAVSGEVTAVTLRDEPMTQGVSFRKEMERNEFREDIPYGSAVFGLYSAESFLSPEGEEIIPEGALIELIVPDGEGYCEAVSMLPEGRYTVRELKTAEGYVMSADELIFGEEEAGPDEKQTLHNSLIKGTLTVLKTDESGSKVLQGAVFELLTEDGKTVGSFVTGEDGSFTVTDLPYGSYILRETTAPEGYRRSDEEAEFFITNDGETVEMILLNEYVPVPQTDGRYPLTGMIVCALAGAAGIASAAALAVRRRKKVD